MLCSSGRYLASSWRSVPARKNVVPPDASQKFWLFRSWFLTINGRYCFLHEHVMSLASLMEQTTWVSGHLKHDVDAISFPALQRPWTSGKPDEWEHSQKLSLLLEWFQNVECHWTLSSRIVSSRPSLVRTSWSMYAAELSQSAWLNLADSEVKDQREYGQTVTSVFFCFGCKECDDNQWRNCNLKIVNVEALSNASTGWC